jgi:hypothetical protein
MTLVFGKLKLLFVTGGCAVARHYWHRSRVRPPSALGLFLSVSLTL